MAATTVAALACAGTGQRAEAFVETDSAGVRITDTKEPAWASGEAWTIDSVPLLDIGSAEGDEPFLLNGAESALRTPDGGVLFANTGTHEVRFFDAGGRFVRSVGRRGDGPGEFGEYSFMMITPAESELLVADEMNNRVNVFGYDGTFLRTVRLEIPTGRARPSLSGAHGSDWVVSSASGRNASKSGVWWRDTVKYLRYRPDGSYLDSIVSVPAGPQWPFSFRGYMTFISVPMTVDHAVLVDSSGLFVRASDGPEVEHWTVDGKLRSRHRWNGGARRRAADIADRYQEEWLKGADSNFRAMIDAFYRSDPVLPKYVATHSRIAAGPQGTIWVQHYYTDWETARRWDVLNRSGRWLGTVDMPARHWLYYAGNDFALAWHRDSLDVEHVTIHRLRRPSEKR